MSIVSILKESSSTNMETRNQVDLNGEPFKTFKFKTEAIYPKHQATVISEKNIGGETLIWGNETYGLWGTYKWGSTASQSFVLGLSKLGLNKLGEVTSEFIITRVIPPNNRFEENFISDYFISTSETTATRTSGNMNFNVTSELLVSKLIYKNSTPVTKATMSIVSTSDVSNFGLYLSNDNGSSWESVTHGNSYSFIDSTGEEVKYKIIPINPDKNITKITVEVNK